MHHSLPGREKSCGVDLWTHEKWKIEAVSKYTWAADNGKELWMSVTTNTGRSNLSFPNNQLCPKMAILNQRGFLFPGFLLCWEHYLVATTKWGSWVTPGTQYKEARDAAEHATIPWTAFTTRSHSVCISVTEAESPWPNSVHGWKDPWIAEGRSQ